MDYKIYIGDSKRKSIQVSFLELLQIKLKEAGIDNSKDGFYDENTEWLAIKLRTDKPSLVTIEISMNIELDLIEDIDVYEADIITIVDDENQRKLT